MRAIQLLLVVCLFSWLPRYGPAAEEGNPSVGPPSDPVPPRFTPVSLVSRPEITSPDSSREALVYVRFLVSRTGIPDQVEVIADRGFHTEPFRETALQFVRGMRFTPATAHGTAVEYGPLTLPVSFSSVLDPLLPEEKGVTPQFRRELNKVTRMLKEKDYEGAHRHADWMLRDTVILRYEYVALQAQLAQTHATVGNLDQALEAAIAATSRTVTESSGFKLRQPAPPNKASNYILPVEAVTYLLELRMQLEARRGELLLALKTFNEMAGLARIKPDDPRAQLADRLVSLLESGNTLLLNARIDKEYWSHELYHPRFTVKNVAGEIDEVHLHCRGGGSVFAFVRNEAWDVPPDWEGCTVEFYGTRGTTFEFLEQPLAASVN